MRKLLIILCLTFLPVVAFGAAGDQPTDQDNAMWQLAASPGYTSTLLSTMNTVGKTLVEHDALAAWMQVNTAIGGLALVNPINVYFSFLNHIEGFTFKRSRLMAESVPPASAGVDGSTVTCLADTTDLARRAYLYEWDFVVFTEVGITGVKASGVWSFADVPAGIYVIVFEGSLPTYFLTVD